MEFKQQDNKIMAIDGEQQAGYSEFKQANENTLIITHTKVFDSYSGQGLAEELTDKVVAYAKDKHLKIQQTGCPYVVSLFERKPEKYADIKVDPIEE